MSRTLTCPIYYPTPSSSSIRSFRTTTTKAHMEEYLAVADLREYYILQFRFYETNSMFFPSLICSFCCHQTASLTKEEVIAIDTAGAQGPPSDIVTKLRATSTKEKILVALVVMMFGVYGLSMFGRMCQ